jgi:ABC-2 type transport system permease protein
MRSGVWSFAAFQVPEIFQWATLANPVRHYIEIVRAVFLKGAGFDAFSRQFAALFLIETSVLLFAAPRFRKISE